MRLGVAAVPQIDQLFPVFRVGPVALGTELVHARGTHLRGRAQWIAGGVADVCDAGTMADFAPNAQFVRNNLIVFAQRQWAGGMAGETRHESRRRVEGSEDYALLVGLAWCDGVAIQ
jgi:hypothetical protein